MTTTRQPQTPPRPAALPRDTAMQLAETEYRRSLALLESLRGDQWDAPTDCPHWDVRTMATHMLGMVEMAASLREQRRQARQAGRRGGVFIDALTALQVEERRDMSPAEIVDRFAARWPKAVRGRRRTPGFIRRRTLPQRQLVGDRQEAWTVGYLIDTILTRDPWMHRTDLARATGAEHRLTPEHDGVLVADVVAEWADRHGRPFTLTLTGPAGGHWSHGSGGEEIELDAVEFCRTVSRRRSGTGLVTTEVPF
jgi:uncharacterized protein (TIGR03083 family)